MEGMLHLKVLRSPHAHARIVSIDKSAALAVPACVAVYHLGGRAAPALQHRIHEDHLRRPRRHLHARQRRALRRPAGGRRGGRDRGGGRGGVPRARGRVRGPAGRVRSRGGDASPARRCCTTRGRRRPQSGNIFCSISTVRSATSRQGFAEADVVHEGTYSTSRVQHVHLETHGSIAWKGEDGGCSPHQLAGAVHRRSRSSAYLFGLARRATSTSSPSASAAVSAASRRWSPRICRCSPR